MHRRGTVRIRTALIAAGATLLIVLLGSITMASPHSFAFATPIEPTPPVTVSDFYPEDSNLSDCVGLVERPGCGSESRGGWRQTLILLAIFGGLTVVFGNIARGVIKNRRTP
ncbi:MAG: hypothetical protein GKR86_12675 [Ilumatobacter sp.]|nr:hypothetical protein [Ilumatobacter sp.]